MKKFIIAMLIVVGIVAAFAIIALLEKMQPVNQDVKKVVEANVQSLNQGNADSYMATLFPSSPMIDSTADTLKTLAEKYTIQTEITKYEQQKSYEYDSTIKVSLRTKLTPKSPGLEPKTLETETLLRLVNEGGMGWRIQDTKIISAKDPNKKS
jgi:hypothetical protein